MSIWRIELTDSRSAWIRCLRYVSWTLLQAVIVWQILRSAPLFLFICFAGVYMAILGLVLDHWRLQHPDASDSEARKRRVPWILVLVAVVPILFFFFG